MESGRFACPSSVLGLAGLLKHGRRALLAGLGSAVLLHSERGTISDQGRPSAHPSKAFDAGLVLGVATALRVWAGWRPGRLATLWRRYRLLKRASRCRSMLFAAEGLVVPPVLIFSPTMRCNFSCRGCYSRDYPVDGELTLGETGSLFHQAEELGATVLVITGGEPLLREGLMELLAERRELLFLLFTNATFIDRTWAQGVARLQNVIPVLSLEGEERHTDGRRGMGVHQGVAEAMAHLAEARAFFGFSAMVTRQNLATLGAEPFVDDMIARGCRIGFWAGYVPSGSKAEEAWVPSREEQTWFRRRVLDLRRRKRILLIHLPDDEYERGGTCMAAGRGFVHVNAQGFVEPCPFAHLASDSVRTSSLKAASGPCRRSIPMV